MAGTYANFLNALGQRESSGNYHAVNQFGYLGKYQMGEGALIDTGYYTADGTAANDWQPSHFTGKGGINSKAQFLASPEAQEAAIRAYMDKQWQYIASVQKYDGQVLGGVKITISGMLAGAHLVGNGGVKTYLNSVTSRRSTATTSRSRATSSNSLATPRRTRSITASRKRSTAARTMTSSMVVAATTRCPVSAGATSSKAAPARTSSVAAQAATSSCSGN
jgi:hypothetical protein